MHVQDVALHISNTYHDFVKDCSELTFLHIFTLTGSRGKK